ncbi:hypothetical protein IW262DRAFT_1450718 [Armillaria fumosa]|nr:hypothetical protein IW262DRAFT_1450718 [Armillaria fumosa]
MSSGKGARRARFEGAWKNLGYNVPGCKLNCGMFVVDIAEIIKGTSLTDDERPKAAMLGWGIELFRTFLVSDDVINSSLTRRGQPCYYGVDIREFFGDGVPDGDDAAYMNKLLRKSTFIYRDLQTAYYLFYLPAALAVYMFHVPQSYASGIQTIEPYNLPKYILVPIGTTVTDILDNKCSWCVNIALRLFTPKQNSECERKVKVVFESPEERVFRELVAMIGEIPGVVGKSALKGDVLKRFVGRPYFTEDLLVHTLRDLP